MTLEFYLASTYADLHDHRAAVKDAVESFSRAAIETYVDYRVVDPAELHGDPEDWLERCQIAVRESSYLILLLGWRYGYIIPGKDISIVELEYDTAIEAGIPIFAFVIDDNHPVAAKHIELSPGADKLRKFKAKVEERTLVLQFSSPSDLAQKLTVSISVLNLPMSQGIQALVEHPYLREENRKIRTELAILRESVDHYKSHIARIVPADPIWRGRNFVLDDTLAFVLIPFQDEFLSLYEDVVTSALAASGLRAQHSGEIFGTREIMEDIWEGIAVSKLVIADVTGRNPNVFYELGIAHTLGKECVVLTQDARDVPFDISSRRYIHYDPGKPRALRSQLENTIKTVLLGR